MAGLCCVLSGGQVEWGHEAVIVTPDRKGTRMGLLLYLLIVIKILIDLVGHTYIYLRVSDLTVLINFAFWYHNSSCTSSNSIVLACRA